jgi:hypothetical protein
MAKRISGKKAIKKDIADSYNEYKFFEGHQYTGMKIGRGHKWYYDKGEWHDKKITPDKWQISFAVNKRRAGKAPEESGAAVGTQYHWFILAHQNVTKLNANVYSTSMTGLKYKLAHKRADKEKWSVTEGTQRKHLIKFLQEVITQLEQAPEDSNLSGSEEGKEKKTTPGVTKAPAKRKTKKKVEREEMVEA